MYDLPMRKKDAKPISKTTRRVSKQDMMTLRRLSRDNQVSALREGRKNRAATYHIICMTPYCVICVNVSSI